MIKVSLNNQPVELSTGTALATALESWQFTEQNFAVAVNGEFVPRSGYAATVLADGDQVDIVKPVGGG